MIKENYTWWIFFIKIFIDIFSFEINLGTVLLICKHARDGWGV